VRAQARTRTRPARRGVVDSISITRRTRRHRKAMLRKLRALTKAAAPTRNCMPAWHEGRHHQRRRGAFHSGSMAGVSTRGKQRSSSPLWLLDEVQCIGVVRRCGLPARGKKRKAATRRQGSRGSRGCSHSWRVRLLPRAAPVFAANGSPTGGSSPPPSLLHSLLLRRNGVGGQGQLPWGQDDPGAGPAGQRPGRARGRWRPAGG
jgi:hypothetical protein